MFDQLNTFVINMNQWITEIVSSRFHHGIPRFRSISRCSWFHRRKKTGSTWNGGSTGKHGDFQALLGTGDEGCNQQWEKNNYEQKWIYMVNLIYTYEHNTFLAGACIDFTIDSKDKSTS